MIESSGTFLEYEVAYRAERLRGTATPTRSVRRRPAGSRFLPGRRGTRATR